MPVKVTCRCQAQLKVKEEWAGRRVKCPKCGEVLTVPRPESAPTAKATAVPSLATSAAENSYALAPQPSPAATQPICPSCQAELSPGAVLCVKCGFHLGKGTRLTTVKAVVEDDSCVPETAVGKCICPSCKYYKPPRAGVCVWCGYHVSLESRVPLGEIARSCGVKDLQTARARVSAQRHAKKCPSCGCESASPGALCGSCDQAEQTFLESQQQVLEEQQQAEARDTPYLQYRQQTVARLTRLWEEILQQGTDEAQSRAALAKWPTQLLSCVPPPELLGTEGLSEENRRTLRWLAEGAKHLAAVTAADVAREAWAQCQPKAVPRATERVAMLCRLAKSLGKNRMGQNRIKVWVVTPRGEHYDGGASEMIQQQLSAALAAQRPDCDVIQVHERLAKDIEQMELAGKFTPELLASVAVERTSGKGDGRFTASDGRCLIVDIENWLLKTEQWSDGSLTATTKVRYLDDEPDPNSPSDFRKVLTYEKQFSSFKTADEMALAWAKSVLAGLPPGFHAAIAPTWAGIDLKCPSCGHPNLITSRFATRQHLCTRCGSDAITGEAETVREMARQLKKAEREGGGLKMLFSPTARRQAREEKQSLQAALAAEQSAASSKLKYPEAVAENQRKIKACGE